jgi:hypothetical protein
MRAIVNVIVYRGLIAVGQRLLNTKGSNMDQISVRNYVR